MPRSLIKVGYGGSSGGAVTSYSTSFPTTETPLSESGKWVLGGTTGRDWNDPKTTGGACYAQFVNGGNHNPNANGSNYDDNIAHLATSVFSATANQYAEGVVSLAGGYTGSGGGHEIELMVRFSITNGVARGYEFLYNIGGHGQLVRWNGAIGDFTSLGDANADVSLADGDTLRIEITGTSIVCKRNGSAISGLNGITDATWSTGQPGLGFDPTGSATLTSFGWKDWTGSNL